MVRQERSAGFVLFRVDPATGRRLYLLLDYGRHWDYAKGHVEAGEDDLTAARRELKEETGIEQIEVIADFSHEIDYYFRSNKRGVIHKAVRYFAARTESSEVILSDEHVGHCYLPYEAALAKLTYATARAVLRAAGEFLGEREGSESAEIPA